MSANDKDSGDQDADEAARKAHEEYLREDGSAPQAAGTSPHCGPDERPDPAHVAKFDICGEATAISLMSLIIAYGWDFQVRRGAAFYFKVWDMDMPSRVHCLEKFAKLWNFQFTIEVDNV